MPEYHQVKADMSSLAFFKNPEKAAQATLDAQRILGVDAAIMFADLLPIMEPMGLRLDYLAGEGPVFDNPVRTEKDVDALVNAPAEEATPYIAHTVKNILQELPTEIALIGFAGAPYTLASYAVEGKGSRNYTYVKKMMYDAPELWDRLMNKLVDQLVSYLKLQIASGVDAVQLFDSWVGGLSVYDFRTYVVPHLIRMRQMLGDDVPVIYFGTGNHHLLADVKAAGFDMIAFDWRTPLAETWDNLGITAVQGNLDPIVLWAEPNIIRRQAQEILDSVADRAGHVFNLGHGIIPETPVDHVKALVDFVHEYTQKN